MPDGLLLHLITALCAAVAGAAVALRLRQPIIVGYIVAGIVIGPFTPGVMGDSAAIAELAEVGIILLMFVVGAQLSLRELVRDSRLAIVGGLLQVAVMVALGYVIGRALGWGSLEAYAFGAVVSNSSSTVLGKVLLDRGELDSRHARIGLAWSSVQDISTVVLVALLSVASSDATEVGPLLGKAALFFCVLVPLGFWIFPRILHSAALPRSREFFALTTVTLALVLAVGATLLGISLALGAFLAGVVVGESTVSHRILGDVIPLRDIFSGIFFVSIGMLLDPQVLVDAWAPVLLTVTLIIVVKGAVVAAIARWSGSATRTAMLVGACLAQSGEFSFLMARIGLETGVLSEAVFNLLLTATVVSILLSPAVIDLTPRIFRGLQSRAARAPQPESVPDPPVALAGHAVVGGHGRVGGIVCALLGRLQVPFVVIEEDLRAVERLRARGVTALFGDIGLSETLDRANIRAARLLILCIPERMAIRRALEHVREVNPSALTLARTHSFEELHVLKDLRAGEVIVGELELALALARQALERFELEPGSLDRAIAEERASHR